MCWKGPPVSILLLGVALAAGGGCSQPGPSANDERKAALADLGEGLKSLADEGRNPPARLADLEPFEPMIPVASPAIRTGEIVYLWGAGYVAGSDKVVAYEKQAPTEGGFVLLQNGTVKEMTVAEFGSAPKAKK